MTKSPQIQGAIGADKIPQHIRQIGSVSKLDYADIFNTPIPQVLQDASAEEWARAMLGDVYNFEEYLAWHVLLRLPLKKEASSELIAGCRVGARGEEWIRIDNECWLMAVNIIVIKEEGRIYFATLFEYRSWVARPWWWLLSHVHRDGVPKLLKQGLRVLPKRK
jgi:hypothetical protein